MPAAPGAASSVVPWVWPPLLLLLLLLLLPSAITGLNPKLVSATTATATKLSAPNSGRGVSASLGAGLPASASASVGGGGDEMVASDVGSMVVAGSGAGSVRGPLKRRSPLCS